MNIATSTETVVMSGATNTILDLNKNSPPFSAKPSLVGSAPDYICLQCRLIDFEAVLHHIANLGPGESGDTIVATRTGLDSNCSICILLSQYVLPGTYQQMPEPQTSWQLRACSIRSMIVDSRTSNLFRPAPIAILHAGDGQRDYIKHLNDEEAEKRGFLVFGKTEDLCHAMENFCDQNDHKYPKSRFIAEKYDPELVRDWMNFQWSESEGDRTSDDEHSEQTHYDTDESETMYEKTPNDWYPDQRYCPGPARPTATPASNPTIEQKDDDNSSDTETTSDQPVAIEGMLVINCQTFEIIDRTSEMSYITLSYVWSLAQEDLVYSGSMTNKRPGNTTSRKLPHFIPRVVHNAIQVVLDLGFHYLWVDKFCIDQQGPIERIMENISKMDLIYSQAEFTIVAASACGALPGVGSTPRVKPVIMSIARPDEKLNANDKQITIFTTPPLLTFAIMRGVWFSRGWCFQESLLSPRRLYFTDHQMFFEAEGIHCCEAYPEPHEDVSDMIGAVKYGFAENPSLAWPSSWEERLEEAQHPQELDLQNPLNRFWVEIDIYLQLVQVYTGKDLSHDSDSINGFRGAIKVFLRNDTRFRVIQGHPIFDISSLEEKDVNLGFFQRRAFIILLDWVHDRSEAATKPMRRPAFPSWSWAGWKGKVKWSRWRRALCEDDYDILGMDVIAIEDSNGDIVTLDEAPFYFEQYPDSPRYLIGEAIILTGESFENQTEDEGHIKYLRLGEDWKLLSWDSDVGFNFTPSPKDKESQHIRHIKESTYGYLLMYASTSNERQSRPGKPLPPTDEARIMVVRWDDDALSSTTPHGCRNCSRIGMATFQKSRPIGSTESSIIETFGSLTKLSFRLG